MLFWATRPTKLGLLAFFCLFVKKLINAFLVLIVCFIFYFCPNFLKSHKSKYINTNNFLFFAFLSSLSLIKHTHLSFLSLHRRRPPSGRLLRRDSGQKYFLTPKRRSGYPEFPRTTHSLPHATNHHHTQTPPPATTESHHHTQTPPPATTTESRNHQKWILYMSFLLYISIK
jgi:hypothetical protein